MLARLSFTLGLLLLAAACGGSSSETPPPVEPSAADLSTYRPVATPAASAATPFDEEEETPKDPDPTEDPDPGMRRNKKKRPVGPPPE